MMDVDDSLFAMEGIGDPFASTNLSLRSRVRDDEPPELEYSTPKFSTPTAGALIILSILLYGGEERVT